MTFASKLIPKHEKLSTSQIKKALKDINVSLQELPLIKRADPALQNLINEGIEIDDGDVIKITRSSKTAGDVLYYRIVVY